MGYQDRRDIDKLYGLIWDNDSNQLNFVEKSDLDEINEKIDLLFRLYENTGESVNVVDTVDGYGINVTFYADSQYAYVTINGDALDVESYGITTIGSMTNTDYAPLNDVYVKCNLGAGYHIYIGIIRDGSVEFINGGYDTDINDIYGLSMYPLTSRLSSS